MAIPKYNELMLPILKIISDKKEYNIHDVKNVLAQNLSLSDEDLAEMLPSGKQTFYSNRVGWAKTYLSKALLIESTGKNLLRITDRGLDLLKEDVDLLTPKYLKKYDEFKDFYGGSKKTDVENDDQDDSDTPEESIETSIRKYNDAIASDLLDNLKNVSPQRFEFIVVDLLVKMGYGGSLKEAGQVVGKSGDEGIDGIIKEDKLGLEQIYIQAKKWENVVGRPEIQKFAGALLGKKARKGVFITTSRFSSEARDYAKNIDANIILIDGIELSGLMVEYNLGVSVKETFYLKQMDTDYFEE